MISIDPGSVMGYMGIGRNANAEKRYTDAIEQFNYVIKLAPDYSSGYSFRAESYVGLKQYDKAIDDIVKALDINGDTNTLGLMLQVADSASVPLVAKLKVQAAKAPNNAKWLYFLGRVYDQTNAYKEAIKYFKSYYEKDPDAAVAYSMSLCYGNMSDFSAALKSIDKAIAQDSTDYDYVMLKADFLYESGNPKEAIAESSKYIRHKPDDYFGYCNRASYKNCSGDIDGAIEDYTTAIALQPDCLPAYAGRGDMYTLKKDRKSAEADYRKVVELDTVPSYSSYAQYAYLALGQKEKAVEFMNDVIAQDSTSAGDYYDAACLYSRMGELDKSVGFLQTALEKGFRRFAHLEMDRDLDPIRALPKYKELVQHYKKVLESEIKDDELQDSAVYEEKTAEIPFTKENGVCKVKCTINKLPLYFVFDTGAADVSLSSVEATFMMKNGYLESSDVIGRQNYMMADGEVEAGTLINLRNVNFGGLDLNNVRASVVHNQAAPLLLGQSILNRLGNIEIDNAKRVLRITYKKKVSK